MPNSSPIADPVAILIVGLDGDGVDVARSLAASEGTVLTARTAEAAADHLRRPDLAVVLASTHLPRLQLLHHVATNGQSDGTPPPPFVLLRPRPVDGTPYQSPLGGPHDLLDLPLDATLFRARLATYAMLHRQQRAIKHRADSLAHESESRFRVMADCAPVLLWMSDTQALCNFFNQGWLDFTGRTIDQEYGYGWAEGVHPVDFQDAMDTFLRSFTRREAFTMEYRLRRADGEYRWLLDNGVPRYLANGTFAGYIGSCIDITARKQAESDRERLLRLEKEARAEAERLYHEATRASRVKDEFLMTLSHELRTPMNAISGWADLLAKGNLDPEDLAAAYATIQRNARTQNRLIDELLDVSRVITGKLQIERRPVELMLVVREAVQAMQLAADAKRITVECRTGPRIAPVVGDATRLTQVVWNLLANAIKFTPTGGHVVVELRRKGPAVAIVVRDTGEGIAPEFIPFVFDRFRQAEGGTVRRHGGLGLGLAIVRHLVELHGGHVEATSQGKGYGATFTVTLPVPSAHETGMHAAARAEARSEAAAAAAAQAKERRRMLGGLKVLLVDDHQDALELATRILRRHGAEVRPAASAVEARELFESEVPDIVVSDVGMPDEDGHMLVRWIRARGDQAGGGVPAIALTAHGQDADVVAAQEAGFQVHLRKPAVPDDLVATVARLGRRAEGASS